MASLGRVAVGLIIPIAITIYSVNFGKWMWHRGIRRGAVGALVISFAALAAITLALWRPWE